MADKKIVYHITHEDDVLLFETLVHLLERNQYDGITVLGSGKDQDSARTKTIAYTKDGVDYLYRVGAPRESNDVVLTLDTGSGSAWFRSMRGEEIADSVRAQNSWEDLISQIAQKFYKENPLLVYKDDDNSFVENTAEQKDNIERVLRTFYDFGPRDIIIKEAPHEETKDIYAVSLRMLVRASAGAPTPVIGKLYFTKDDNNNMVFLDKADAEQIEKQLLSCTVSALPDQDKKTRLDNAIYNILRDLLVNREHLEDKFVFNKDNINVIDQLTESLRRELQQGDVEVEISEITANMYFVITVKVAAFDVYLRKMPRPAMKATVLFDRISLECLNCSQNNNLMNDNNLHYVDDDHVAHDVKIAYDEDSIWFVENNRLIQEEAAVEEMVDTLKRYVFSDHLMAVSCKVCVDKRECTRYVCKNKQLPVLSYIDADDGRPVHEIKCADCLYSESYVWLGDAAYSPDLLYFDADKKRLAYGEHTYCTLCGRPIGSMDEFCSLCAGLMAPKDKDKAAQRRLYRAYSGLLPMSRRFLRFGKRCVEDQSTIVFKVGSKTYHFDKLDGFIKGFRPNGERR